VPSLKIPTADADGSLGTRKVDGGAIFVFSKGFTDTQKLHFNVGYTFIGNASDAQLQDVLFIGLTWTFDAPWKCRNR
jgi:hypothetical protein